MTKAVPSTLLAFAFFLVPAIAAAQSAAPSPSSCPPGSGFCAEPPPEQTQPTGKPVQPLAPLPNPDQPPPPHSGAPPPPPPPPPYPPPAVVYQAPPATMAVRPETPPPYVIAGPPYGPPPYGPPLPQSEWGLNLHIEGVGVGHGRAGSSAGMGGAGAGLRFKPTRRFGIEADLDFVGGNDYQGLSRGETALTFNGLFYLNPRSRAQVYFLAGFGWAGAHVTCDFGSVNCPAGGVDEHYGYFGGQLGGGLELRLARAIALNADLRGFIRTRTDDLARVQPEFIDAYGRTTNTSGGALLTAGMTLYF